MRIKEQDLTRLSILRYLCVEAVKEVLEWDDDVINWSAGKLYVWLCYIGTVSTWLSDQFKRATRLEIMWGLVAMLKNAPDYSDDNVELLYQIATDDILTLTLACTAWLEDGDTFLEAEGD